MKYLKSIPLLLVLSILAMGPSAAQAPMKPFGAVPTERQLRWHEMEMYCLIHFTPTTFQNKEWGFGDAAASLFNPSHFDAHQIASAAAAGGFKGLISVAKHHDGFCLWPTKTTTYSIQHSPWKQGQGDMVYEFMQAAQAHHMKFGVYLSAWDRNDIRYGSAAYAEAYREQLTELMSNYGPVFTSWHDGANGGDGYYGGLNEKRTIDRSTYYAWQEKTWPIVRRLQPMAMIFSDVGPDMRWVGNEKGSAGETSWATISPRGIDGQVPVPGLVDEKNLTTGDRFGEFWIPAECDVPQRPGWFYHPEQDLQVKTPNELFEIYIYSVGRGGAMNLGLAPMPEGRLHAYDVASLQAFGEKIKQTFAHNLAKGAQLKASNIRIGQPLENILDEDRYSFWATEDQVHQADLEVQLAQESTFDLIQLRENIKLGQRIDSVIVEINQQGAWQPIAQATSIGANRLIKLAEPMKAERLRIRIFAPVAFTLSDFGLYREVDIPFAWEGQHRKKMPASEIAIQQTADFRGNLAAATDGNPHSSVEFIDYQAGIILEFQNKAQITGFSYLPNIDKLNHAATQYKIYSSLDGQQWTELAEGEFSNIKANPIAQEIIFSAPEQAKFIKFVPLALVAAQSFVVSNFELFVLE